MIENQKIRPAKVIGPLGEPLSGVGLRFVNRTAHYRCKPSERKVSR